MQQAKLACQTSALNDHVSNMERSHDHAGEATLAGNPVATSWCWSNQLFS